MARCQKYSVFPVYDHGGSCFSDSGKRQAAGVSESSAVRAFIPANHLCPRLPAPPRGQPCLQKTGPDVNRWLEKHSVAKLRTVTFLLAPTPCNGCPQSCGAVPDMEWNNCCSHILLHSADVA